ncbi:translation initiation factor IF-2-like [Salvia splendens]|uniref:translation initiation factor IF-2-like n=1 Tax=Salvia splendens TaxID=180675 RepID=UPI001C27EA3B|nr:translation initiation factor IF-2-like [Salvia splendens]
MSNNEAPGRSESSSSNPIPPPVEGSPRRRRGAANPRGRGSPPQNPLELALYNQPPPRTPPTMGTPGRTAYWAPPPPPPQQWPFPGPSHGHGGFGSQAIPVGGGGGSGSGGGGIRIGGGAAARKRNRDGGAGGGARNQDAAGGGAGGDGYHYCSVCQKGFSSTKALFGHMRSHPDRGWKGVHPPPTFRAEEEFADLHMAGDVEGAEDAGDDEENFRVPDLNQPPPEDSN